MSSKTHSVIKEEGKGKREKKQVKKELKSERNQPYRMPKPAKSKMQSIVQRSVLYSEVSFQEYQQGDHPCESAFISN